jgi:hypothetical protein
VLVYNGKRGNAGHTWVSLRRDASNRPLMQPVRSDRLDRSDMAPQTGQIRPDTEKFFREGLPRGVEQLQELDEPVRCFVCERDVDEAAYVGGQWWCADHVERAA